MGCCRADMSASIPVDLVRFLSVAVDVFVIVRINVELFELRWRGPAAHTPFGYILAPMRRLSEIHFHLAESGECHRKIRIECDCLLEERYRGLFALITAGLYAEAIGF